MLTYSAAFGLEYPSGFTFMEVPDPLSGDNPTYPLTSRSIPSIGEPFFDPHFGTILTRVTQIDQAPNVAILEYSRFDPFNKDQSMIILLPEYDWRVFRTQSFPYNQDANLVTVLHDIAEPRWDPNDPNLVWGEQGFQLLTVNVLGETTIIKDFSNDPTIQPILQSEPDLYQITMMSEGESSQDKRYWAFCLQGSAEDYRVRYIFTWDRLQDKILGLYQIPLNDSDIDWVGMSALGNWVLIGGQPDNSGNLIGLTMANKELTQFHQLNYDTAHSDVGLDIQGNEVIVMQNSETDYIDLIPIDLSTTVVTNANDYPGSNHIRLIRLYYNDQSPIGLNSGVHISCNVPGYCVVSTTTQPNVPEQNWLDRTITLVKLDRSNPRVFYLAKVYNTTNTYWEETHASITNDGRKVVWADNWGQYVQEGQNPTNFLMQLDMPSDWMNPGCPSSLSPQSESFGASGGSDTVNVTAPSGCAWTATSNATWINITSGTSGSGDGSVNYTVSPNTGSDRTGTLTIAGKTFTVSQTGVPQPETVSTPNPPDGPTSGSSGTSYTYTTGGSASSKEHSVQYLLDWGDGTSSGWLPVGTTSASHSWNMAGIYTVKVQARCATDINVISGWSNSLTVNIGLIQCTVTTNPSGLQITADGTTYGAPQTFNWTPGSSHILSVPSPQSGTAGIRYIYSSWSDGGGQTHSVTVPSSSTTYTATFTPQYQLTITSFPPAGGTVTPSPMGDQAGIACPTLVGVVCAGYYSSGTLVTVTATPNTGYIFYNWSGDASGTNNPVTLTMDNNRTVAANFTSTLVIPPSGDFKKVKVKTSKTASFVVKNNGKASLSITSSTITGTDASMFKITSGGGSKTIKPGKSLTIKVAFKPTSTGPKSAILEIISNDPVAPTIDVPLSGTGQ